MLNIVKLSVVILSGHILRDVMLSVMRLMLCCVKYFSFLTKIFIILVPPFITDALLICCTTPRKHKT
jgi:hypothetical protein